jgi:hypothetical protein
MFRCSGRHLVGHAAQQRVVEMRIADEDVRPFGGVVAADEVLGAKVRVHPDVAEHDLGRVAAGAVERLHEAP